MTISVIPSIMTMISSKETTWILNMNNSKPTNLSSTRLSMNKRINRLTYSINKINSKDKRPNKDLPTLNHKIALVKLTSSKLMISRKCPLK